MCDMKLNINKVKTKSHGINYELKPRTVLAKNVHNIVRN